MFQKELLFLKRFLLTINKVFWTQCLMNWKQQMELMYIKIFVMFSASTWIKMIKIIEIFLFHKSILLFRITINSINSQLSAIQDLCFLWFGRLILIIIIYKNVNCSDVIELKQEQLFIEMTFNNGHLFYLLNYFIIYFISRF